MSAGTVVITGGILATVILLCIIAVLCYCRLQYYFCKKNGSDPDAVCPQPQFAPVCVAYMPSHYDGPSLSLTLPSLLSRPDLYSNTQARSTDV